ncbi:Crp/Fnr family transcriptional regulator [Variovorax sp. J22P271]|uniref:Crp/Fnr family transcriptional regulator n=1 Tax=Variovorax davisae TaxID=3053515 RepID=UPI0025786A19|nr:Crp/Fnr family transcriptional regulator [Variovorax sp. J22P271]MDM0035762.1 Crp/Fnr family transcriptional regulator [Variovorax sp. J22P271]
MGSLDEDAGERLPQTLLDAIAPYGVVRSFPAQAILINEGDATDSLYIVLSGRVKVYASSEDGRELVLSEYGPGSYFGELSLDGERRSASIKAIEACSCRVVQGAELRRFLEAHAEFAMHLNRKLIRMVRRLTEQLSSIALQDVYGRVVRVLNELSEPVGEERVLRHKLTQQDIADRIGCSREMVNRVMKELTAGGYVVQRDGRLAILRKLPLAW